MLAAQMVACHHAALDCPRRAAVPQQTQEVRAMSLRQAARLMTLYCRQTEVLDGRRGRHRGTVSVGRVNVAFVGQAVVGQVDTDGRRA